VTRHDCASPTGSRHHRMTQFRRCPRPRGALLALVTTISIAVGAGGCGGAQSRATTESPPAYVTAAPSREQQLVSAGATLIVSDGCSACHLTAGFRKLAPSFETLAGHRVTLTDGKRVLVDQAQIREALHSPDTIAIRGYDRSLMVDALRKAHPSNGEIAALAAFIEQVGPE